MLNGQSLSKHSFYVFFYKAVSITITTTTTDVLLDIHTRHIPVHVTILEHRNYHGRTARYVY